MVDYPDNPFLAENEHVRPSEDVTRVGPTDYYHSLVQGTDEWLALRHGMITASNMNKILTPTLKTANNEKSRAFHYELAADRITGRPEPHYMSYDMERGHLEEAEARKLYSKEIAPVQECGFVISHELSFPFGMSPDGLVGDDGMIECKSRLAKYQVQTIFDHIVQDAETPIPVEFMLQVQSGLFVTKRKWCDFLSYSNGLNMTVIRCFPDPEYQDAIMNAVVTAQLKISLIVDEYKAAVSENTARIFPVEWIDHADEINA